jgi:RNA polymerase sigma-70 factor (ECF subfamily)
MREAIDRLPADQRVVMLLASLEGMNCEETAQLLSIPRPTVLARNVRARNSLRQLTSEEEPARSA